MKITILKVRPIKSILSAFIPLFFLSYAISGLAQDNRVYIDPANYFEMVKFEVLSIDRDGNGVLRVQQHDCGGCTSDFSFTSSTLLETPLGAYTGLDKLSDWDDKTALIVVGKVDGIVRRVTIN